MYDTYLRTSAIAEFDTVTLVCVTGAVAQSTELLFSFFCKTTVVTPEENDFPSLLNDEEERRVALLVHGVYFDLKFCVYTDYLDEPAAVQRRLKPRGFGAVRLHVEDKGEGSLISLGDLLEPLLFTSLKQHSVT